MADENMQEAAEHAKAAADAATEGVKVTARRMNIPNNAFLVVAGTLFAGGVAYDLTRRSKKTKKVKKVVVVEDVEQTPETPDSE